MTASQDPLVKRSCQFYASQYDELMKVAARRHQPVAGVVREAVDLLLERERRLARDRELTGAAS